MRDFFSVKGELAKLCLKMGGFRMAEIGLTEQGVVSPEEASQAPI
jgi:hypothetical protein